MVSDEDERICESQWAQTRRKRDLGSFVHDTIVELPTGEKRAKMVSIYVRMEEPMTKRALRTGQLINRLWQQQAGTSIVPLAAQP